MKLAISAAVACLLAQSHGVDGASLRGQQDENSERKLNLNGYNPYNTNPYGSYNYYPPRTINPLPTERPTPVPTPRPTPEPTPQPTKRPSVSPSSSPSASPTPQPSAKPSAAPSTSPSGSPSKSPSSSPSNSPSADPSSSPSTSPSVSPSAEPSQVPTIHPSAEPTVTDEPSEQPTVTDEPSEQPTETDEPSEEPTESLEPTRTEMTAAEIICDAANYPDFLGFCTIIQLTRLDFILNNFQDLDEEYIIVDDLITLEELLLEFELENLAPLFCPLVPTGDGFFDTLCFGEESPTINPTAEITSENTQFLEGRTGAFEIFNGVGRRLQNNVLPDQIEFEAYVTEFLKENYNVEVRGDFDEFIQNFIDSADNNQVFTVFVPNNVAMEQLNTRTSTKTTSERTQILQDFGEYHVYVGDRELEFDDLDCPPTPTVIKMANGLQTETSCEFQDNPNRITRKYQVGISNSASLGFPKIKRTQKDTFASNGILQVVDNVVIEPFPI